MIHILIRYLGIKTKLLEPIKNAIRQVTLPNESVLDLFAGSNTVGQYLLNDYCVYSNDYQRYSYVAGKALIERHSNDVISNLDLNKVLGEYYLLNRNELISYFSEPLKYEETLLNEIGDNYIGQVFDNYKEFFNNSPYYGHIKEKHPIFKNCLKYFSKENLKSYEKQHSKFPYLLFSTYYNNPYFSLRQCVEIDSIRYSLDKILQDNSISQEEWYIYLSFLIYALHLIVISVGDHFAQPQKIKGVSPDYSNERDSINIRERKKIISKKRLSVIDLFSEKLNDYKQNYIAGNVSNTAWNCDFKELLVSNEFLEANIKTIYIDPPYTNAHYSRFYHIPETLVLYDYPSIQYYGRYRTDRYQSNFCIKTKAFEEFDTMLSSCRNANVNTVISYSDTTQCILKIEDIRSICHKYYGQNVNFQNVDHMYRNFGQKPNKILAKEYIITCFISEV